MNRAVFCVVLWRGIPVFHMTEPVLPERWRYPGWLFLLAKPCRERRKTACGCRTADV